MHFGDDSCATSEPAARVQAARSAKRTPGGASPRPAMTDGLNVVAPWAYPGDAAGRGRFAGIARPVHQLAAPEASAVRLTTRWSSVKACARGSCAWRDWIRQACGDRGSRQGVTERAESALADGILTLTELSEIYELCAEEGHATTP